MSKQETPVNPSSRPAEEALAYISSAFAATEGAYSAAKGLGCKTAASSAAGGVTLSPGPGYRRLSATPAAVMAALRFEGPVVTYMRVDAAFAAYDGGKRALGLEPSMRAGWMGYAGIVACLSASLLSKYPSKK